MTDRGETQMTGRNSAGKTVQRPLSPHLQIYKPQLTTGMSIFHRITGVGLSVGTLLLVWWLVAAASSNAAYGAVAGLVGSPIGLLLMFGWTLALWYHFCNGIRHMAWDSGYWLDLPQLHASGKAVLAATVMLTLLTWVVLLATL